MYHLNTNYIIDNFIKRDLRSVSFAVNVSKFKSFLNEINKIGSTGSIDDLKITLKNNKVGLDVFDNLLESSSNKITKQNNILHMNDIHFNKVEYLMKTGDLTKLSKTLGSQIFVDAPSNKTFKSLTSEFPQKTLNDIESISLSVKQSKVEIDFNLSNIDKLSKAGIKETTTIGNRLKKLTSNSGKIALAVGVLYIGVDWLKTSLENRKGCWLVTTINNKTTSCRMSRNTCGIIEGKKDSKITPPECTNRDTLDIYNAVIFLINVINGSDTALKDSLKTELGIDTLDNVSGIVKDKIQQLDTFTKVNIDKMKTMNMCAVHTDIESGKLPYCRMCDPVAHPSSTNFVNVNGLSSNMTLHCVEDPSVLELLSDIVATTGKNIYESALSIGSIIPKVLKYGGWFILLAIIIAVVSFVYLNFFRHSKTEKVFITSVEL